MAGGWAAITQGHRRHGAGIARAGAGESDPGRVPYSGVRQRIATLAELPDRTALKFPFERGGVSMTGILANHAGHIVAYVNRCRHVPFPLDWGDGRFYTRDREFFLCHTHGAVYEPQTGLCVQGPCAGDYLESLAVEVVGDEVFVVPGG